MRLGWSSDTRWCRDLENVDDTENVEVNSDNCWTLLEEELCKL